MEHYLEFDEYLGVLQNLSLENSTQRDELISNINELRYLSDTFNKVDSLSLESNNDLIDYLVDRYEIDISEYSEEGIGSSIKKAISYTYELTKKLIKYTAEKIYKALQVSVEVLRQRSLFIILNNKKFVESTRKSLLSYRAKLSAYGKKHADTPKVESKEFNISMARLLVANGEFDLDQLLHGSLIEDTITYLNSFNNFFIDTVRTYDGLLEESLSSIESKRKKPLEAVGSFLRTKYDSRLEELRDSYNEAINLTNSFAHEKIGLKKIKITKFDKTITFIPKDQHTENSTHTLSYNLISLNDVSTLKGVDISLDFDSCYKILEVCTQMLGMLETTDSEECFFNNPPFGAGRSRAYEDLTNKIFKYCRLIDSVKEEDRGYSLGEGVMVPEDKELEVVNTFKVAMYEVLHLTASNHNETSIEMMSFFTKKIVALLVIIDVYLRK